MENQARHAESPKQVFQWLLSLDPCNLRLFITIGEEKRVFTGQNWGDIAAFSADFSADRAAHFLISRPANPDSPNPRLLAGAGFFGGDWEIFPPSFIRNLLQTEPGSFEVITPCSNLHPANLKELFPDSLLPEMTEAPSEAPITHELYQPAQTSPIFQDVDPLSILGVFQWLHQLEQQHLRAEVGIEDHRATFTASNWQDIPAFAADAHECLDGCIILHLHPPGVDLPTVTGLQLIDREWNIIRPEYLKHYVSSTEAVSFANILDIYPDCPVPAGNLVPE